MVFFSLPPLQTTCRAPFYKRAGLLLCLLLSALVIFFSLPAFANEDNSSWTLVSDRNDIKVFMTPSNDNSRLKTFRGEMVIQLKDQYVLAGILNDYESFPRWLHFVDAAVELNRPSPLLRYLRFATQLPWPLSNRDAVLQARVMQEQKPPLSKVTIYLDARPELIPEQKGYVRFPEMRGVMAMEVLDEDMNTKVTYQLTLDPGGYIPTWISNILLRDAPYFTLLRLRQRIKEPQYQNLYYDYLDLVGPGRPKHTLPDTASNQP